MDSFMEKQKRPQDAKIADSSEEINMRKHCIMPGKATRNGPLSETETKTVSSCVLQGSRLGRTHRALLMHPFMLSCEGHVGV